MMRGQAPKYFFLEPPLLLDGLTVHADPEQNVSRHKKINIYINLNIILIKFVDSVAKVIFVRLLRFFHNCHRGPCRDCFYAAPSRPSYFIAIYVCKYSLRLSLRHNIWRVQSSYTTVAVVINYTSFVYI